MKLILQKNRWSCVVTSFAMVLDVPVLSILEIVKHDGSEIYWPELPEPNCRRGFHIQEMIDVCYLLGALVTPFQARPTSISAGANFLRIPQTFVSPEERITRALTKKGILIGETLDGQKHAVAWDGERVFDPAGGISDIALFQIETFWMVTILGSSSLA